VHTSIQDNLFANEFEQKRVKQTRESIFLKTFQFLNI